MPIDIDTLEEAAGDHHVDPELLELHEVLEYTGKRKPKFPKLLGAPAPPLLSVPGTIVTRAQWGARPARSSSGISDIRGSTAHYEGPHMGTFSHDSCAPKVRGIQAFHMDNRGWADIAYTSLTCPHGVIYVCRWWRTRTAAQGTNFGNDHHYAHCVLMGVDDPLTDEAKRGLRTAFDLARSQGGAGAEQKIHSDWHATACPGDPIRSFVRAGLPAASHPEPPITFVGTLEEKVVRAEVKISTDDHGNGFRDTGIPWSEYRSVSGVGFDPPYVGGYKNPVVTAHDVNEQVRVVITGWIPNNQGTAYVGRATN